MNFESKGKTYVLTFNYNAIADIEEASGRGIGNLLSESVVGLHVVRYLVWGGLRSRIPGITKAKAGEILHDYIMENGQEAYQSIAEKIIKELNRSLSNSEQSDEGAGE